MDFLSGLNSAQQEAVLHGQGPVLVLAGAGSGKTRVITCRILHLIHARIARPEHIYAVTFTNKAADEMKARVQSMLPVEERSGPWISTFHSLCVRILRMHAGLLGYTRDFTIFDSEDQARLVKTCLKDLSIQESQFTPRKALSLISLSKNTGREPETGDSFSTLRQEGEALSRIMAEYQRRLRLSNAMDFDDLLCKSLELLGNHEAVRLSYQNRIRYLLVDEYQDTNLLQHRLMQLLVAEPWNICAVGDEDQSIYSFRGARIGNILTFEKDFPGTRILKLEQNYRSSGNILQAASAVVGKNRQRRGKVLWTENKAGELLHCFSCSTGNDEAQRVCRTLLELRLQHPRWTFAVLYRTNFQSRYFEEELRRHHVPFRLIGALSFYARAEIKDLLAYLRFLRNPDDSLALERIINTPPRGIGDQTIEKMKSHANQKRQNLWLSLQAFAEDFDLSGRIQKRLKEFVGMIKGLQDEMQNASLSLLVQRVADRSGYRQMLQEEKTTEAQSRLGNIEELVAAAQEWESQGFSTAEFLDRASLSSDTDNYEQRSLVTLMTLHAAKGLEFDTVFLAGLEEGLFPHQQSLNHPSQEEEERRLCYVGMTRARKQLFLSWATYRRTFSSNGEGQEMSLPSRFLKEIPDHLIRRDHRQLREAEGEAWEREGSPNPAKRAQSPSFAGKTYNTKTSVAQFLEGLAVKQALAKEDSSPAEQVHKDSRLGPGMRVRHPNFGTGRVITAEKQGEDTKLTVQFDLYGRKKLLQSFSKLTRV
jgi:DNA helicase II / ATP-dependent DNA helicase PcrA